LGSTLKSVAGGKAAPGVSQLATATAQLALVRHSVRKRFSGMVSLLLPVSDGDGVVQALASGRFSRAGRLGFSLGLFGRLTVPFSLCGPVRAIGPEGEECGQNGDDSPAARAEEAGDATEEGEGDHAGLP
jgi:hypothetical protein